MARIIEQGTNQFGGDNIRVKRGKNGYFKDLTDMSAHPSEDYPSLSQHRIDETLFVIRDREYKRARNRARGRRR